MTFEETNGGPTPPTGEGAGDDTAKEAEQAAQGDDQGTAGDEGAQGASGDDTAAQDGAEAGATE